VRDVVERQDTISRLPVGLDADAIVTAAVDLLDECGLDGFTIRALGLRLGVSAPTIYWHVGSKDALLQAVVERVVADSVAPPRSRMGWEKRLRRLFDLMRRSLLAHPGVLELLRSVHVSAFEHWMAEALTIMRSAGFGDSQAAVYARITLLHSLGATQADANVRAAAFMEPVPNGNDAKRFRVKPGVLRQNLPADLAAATVYDPDQQHQILTDIFIDGLRAQIAGGGA
jgi:AcrR family transcriptional regulator